MELIFALILLCIGLPAVLAVGLGAAVIVGYLALVILALVVRFWYISLGIMLVAVAPILYFTHWLFPVLAVIVLFAVILYFVPLSEQQKAELAQLKLQQSLQKEISALHRFGHNSKA